MTTRYLRIHGDNIVECERTLKLIAEAYNSKYELLDSPVYFPKYSIQTPNCLFVIELLSGHGRWSNIDLGDIIYKSGGKLRESADSYLTEILDNIENVLLGIEYCSALPAGNNAWQRNGRALASVLANVPYLYYAEIGGIELDENRTAKAPRYPNPAVPFSYLSLSHDINSVCLPIYLPHPSMTDQNIAVYKAALGYNEGLIFIRQILNGEDTTQTVNSLKSKAIKMLEILSNVRRKKDTLKGKEWKKLLNSTNRPIWLINKYKEEWDKKSSNKVVVSDTFELLKSYIKTLDVVPITAKDLPFCIVPKHNLPLLKAWIKKTYNGLEVSFDLKKDLALVWITGFKPKGDDSRPDRGLAPLCRMILGKRAKIMAIISGPATKHTWEKLQKAPKELCESNGLFEAIFSCCNYLFIDSATCDQYIFMHTSATLKKNTDIIKFPYIQKPVVRFFEHDTDCAIHQILSSHEEIGIHECFCNPPGGDWSGISLFMNDKEYKWTSLPRVSKSCKRPDHIFQIERNGNLIFVPIESKGYGINLENNIGNRLKDYINDLFNSEPTAYKTIDSNEWRFFDGTIDKMNYSMISVGAFLYKNERELATQLIRGNLDAIFAFEFGDITTLHFYANANGDILLDYLKRIALEQSSFVIKVHSF